MGLKSVFLFNTKPDVYTSFFENKAYTLFNIIL